MGINGDWLPALKFSTVSLMKLLDLFGNGGFVWFLRRDGAGGGVGGGGGICFFGLDDLLDGGGGGGAGTEWIFLLLP